MIESTSMSPNALAILIAYKDNSWMPNENENDKYLKFSHANGMAAALRVASSQLTSTKAIDHLRTIANELEQHAQCDK